MTDKQDPIAHAARLLREAAEELRQAHAYSNSEGWENETDAKAAYDEHLAAAQALEDWEAAVGAGGVEPLCKQVAPQTQAAPDERAAFEKWLRVKPCGAAHDFGWEAWRARAALAATYPTQPAPHLPERDASLPAERQGLFRKFVVGRVDGSDKPGGKHHGCTYFVLDVDHDPCARPALAAYAAACESTHPTLAADLRTKWGVVPAPQPAPAQPAPQQEAQEPCPSCRNSDIYACTCTFPTSRNAAPQPAPLSEREAFERDWEKRHAPVPINGRTHDDGRYGDLSIQDAWESWQARAAIAA